MTSTTVVRLESTGQATLDAILGGGIPAQSVNVIAGAPGSGKTIFTLQMLFHAARQGKKSVYFTTLSEPAIKVIRYMQAFDFFDPALLDKFIVFVDLASAIRRGAETALAEIVARVEEYEPSFVTIDSFRAIGDLLNDTSTQRSFVYDLANQMTGWGATTFLVGEYLPHEFSGFAEFAVADAIIRLGATRDELSSQREIEILKLRGANYVTGLNFFDIGPSGVIVYPRVRAPDSHEEAPDLDDRTPTGIAGLDELLHGGLPRASATLLQGGTGTGKTLLAMSILVQGAQAGEPGVFFTHEETAAQLRSAAKSLGWDLRDLEAQGLLAIRYTSPVELSTDRFLSEARHEVARLKARRVVFDSLTALSLGVSSDRRFKELVYSLAKHMRAAGVSLVLTMESEQHIGSASLSGLGVSFLSDNLIQLRFFEFEGRLERAISVIKARGIKSESEVRSLVIERGGMKVVGQRFAGMRGVLTGLPERT